MSPGAVSAGVLLLGVTAYASALPWHRQGQQGSGKVAAGALPPVAEAVDLDDPAEASYAALSDLEFDQEVGKLNDDDYQLVRGQIMA